MTKVKIYTKNKMKFWVRANDVTVQMNNLQFVRYDIYTTANKRNFYTFKKALLEAIEHNDDMTFYDVINLGQDSRIVGVAAYRPKEE